MTFGWAKATVLDRGGFVIAKCLSQFPDRSRVHAFEGLQHLRGRFDARLPQRLLRVIGERLSKFLVGHGFGHQGLEIHFVFSF